MSAPAANRASVLPPPSPRNQTDQTDPRSALFPLARDVPALSAHTVDHLAALEPLTEELSTSLTCPICLDHMHNARQLQCGHLFCSDCVLRILRMPKIRCALCKQKTSKRMVRTAPLPFQQITRGLHLLQRLIQDNKVKRRLVASSPSALSSSASTPHAAQSVAIKDGFHSSVSNRVLSARFRADSQSFLQNRKTKSPSIPLTSNGRTSGNSNVYLDSVASTPVTASKSLEKKSKGKSRLSSTIGSATSADASEVVPRSNDLFTTVPKSAVKGPRKCMLCPQPQDRGMDEKENVIESESNFIECGRWVEVTNVQSRDADRWVHEKCVLFSEDIYQVDGLADNVQRVVARAGNRTCSFCQQTGATIRCWAHTNKDTQPKPNSNGFISGCCNAVFHYHCAVQHGCVFVEDGYRMYCPKHKDDVPRIDERTFVQALTEPADESSVEHDDFCYICHTGGRLLMCDTCTRTTHPACSGLRNIPIGDWSCGVCTGTGGQLVLGSVDTAPCTARRSSVASRGSVGANGSKRSRASEGDRMLESIFGSLSADRGGRRNGSAKRSRRGSVGSDMSGGYHCAGKRLIVAATGLSDDQKEAFAKFAKVCRVTVKDDVEERVTHVVIGAASATDKPTRTMKLCRAVARRLPIVCWPWVSTSISNEQLSSTAGYIHSVTRDEKEAPVFDGRVFSFSTFSGDKNRRGELSELIKLGGGLIASREWASFEGVVFVRNDDAVQQQRHCSGGQGSHGGAQGSHGGRWGKSRFEPPDGATVVPYTWILDQITQRSNSATV